MLQSNVRRAALANLGTLTRPSAARAIAAAHRARILRPAVALHASQFHSSSRRNELPKSPFQTFVDVLKEEIQKSRELQEDTKQVSGRISKLQDSEALKRTREFYERARVTACKSLVNAAYFRNSW
jgi:import inner membrane translocase subunit TIM44